MVKEIDQMVELAKEGDGDAVEWLIRQIQDRVYALALRMLYTIPDAEDATQEILIKIVTRIGGFRNESSFFTWAMKIAANHLLNRRKRLHRHQFTFESCEEMIVKDVPDRVTARYPEAEQGLLIDEIRVTCVQGLLQCLDRDHRIVYILSRTMDVSGVEGSAILGITPANFRKRFSRARRKIQAFLVRHCELFRPENHCRCRVQAMAAIDNGLIDPDTPRHMTHPRHNKTKKEFFSCLQEMDALSREAALMRIHPDYAAPERFIERIKTMLHSGNFQNLIPH